MPTNNKSSLGLNLWTGTDKPKRSDFVQDNTLLDSLLSSHFQNQAIQITAADRLKLDSGIKIGTYVGTGASSYTVSLEFSPRLVLVYKVDAPLTEQSGSFTKINMSLATGSGSSSGMELDGPDVTVYHSATSPTVGTVWYNLNDNGSTYVYLAVR